MKRDDPVKMELILDGIQKKFGEKEVLRGVSFPFEQGKIYGLLGRNGAGKTTTMKAILGLLQADGGEIEVFGERVHYGQTATNKMIGYLPDVPAFYSYMRPGEYLKLCGEILSLIHI